MSNNILIEPFRQAYADDVVVLFTEINLSLATAETEQAFKAYIQNSIEEEISRIDEYYSKKRGGFWLALKNNKLAGMYGLESVSISTMELRRMYVAPSERRQGIAQKLLGHAEEQCALLGKSVLELSTSEIQQAALQLYQNAGFNLVSEATAEEASNKTIGGGIRRYYFEKRLGELGD